MIPLQLATIVPQSFLIPYYVKSFMHDKKDSFRTYNPHTPFSSSIVESKLSQLNHISA